jgi:hypothetical protein
MANTWQLPILGANTVPDTTGRCWVEPYSTIATNKVWAHLVFRFLDPASGNNHGLYGQFTVPQNYVSSPVIVPILTTTATSGNMSLWFTYRDVPGNNTTSLDQTGNTQQVNATVAAPGAAHRRLAPTTLTLTAGNLAAGDTVEFLFERRDNSAVDTMAADFVLFDLLFQYADG